MWKDVWADFSFENVGWADVFVGLWGHKDFMFTRVDYVLNLWCCIGALLSNSRLRQPLLMPFLRAIKFMLVMLVKHCWSKLLVRNELLSAQLWYCDKRLTWSNKSVSRFSHKSLIRSNLRQLMVIFCTQEACFSIIRNNFFTLDGVCVLYLFFKTLFEAFGGFRALSLIFGQFKYLRHRWSIYAQYRYCLTSSAVMVFW